MKKLHISFGIITGIMTLAALVIGFVEFTSNVGNPYTSFPWWAPFAFVGIYYAMGLAIVGAVWLIAWLIMRYITCKRKKKLL